MPTTFGVHTGPADVGVDELLALWRRIEELPFEWISIWDHFYAATGRSTHCLEAVAMQLMPTGTINYEGSPLLVMGSKRFEAGTRFTVTYNNEDYDLELVAIDRTTFTLRYKGEVFTRPIKSVR